MRLVRAGAALALRLAAALAGWLVVAPLGLVVPRRRDWIAVIGRDDGRFLDNCKYFFLQASAARAGRIVFVTERREVEALLAAESLECLRYPSVAAVWFLLRAGSVVVDSVEWTAKWRAYLLIGAFKVQLWHGVGFKRIEQDRWRHEVGPLRRLSSPTMLRLRLAYYRFVQRFVRYDLVLVTSTFYRDKVFAPAFRARRFLLAGYPRNTFGAIDEPLRRLSLLNTDTSLIARIEAWKSERRRVVLLAPTFRESGAMPMQMTETDIAALEQFCETERVEMIFKFHPGERAVARFHGRHLHVYRSDADVYPMLPLVDVLVTDYSSIFMDFLLVDRPIVFFMPDIQLYRSQMRETQFDPDAFTPGPKASTWGAVLERIADALREDSHRATRARVRELAFGDRVPLDSVPQLLDLMDRDRFGRGKT